MIAPAPRLRASLARNPRPMAECEHAAGLGGRARRLSQRRGKILAVQTEHAGTSPERFTVPDKPLKSRAKMAMERSERFSRARVGVFCARFFLIRAREGVKAFHPSEKEVITGGYLEQAPVPSCSATEKGKHQQAVIWNAYCSGSFRPSIPQASA